VVEHNFLSGKTLLNAEKFKYTQQNVGGYSTIAETAWSATQTLCTCLMHKNMF
jgi:hypothetical protein